MVQTHRDPDRRLLASISRTLAPVLALALSACGGGSGGGVVSTPPPVFPPAPSVFDVFAARQYQAISTRSHLGDASGGHVTLEVNSDALTYTLTIDDPSILMSSIVFNPESAGHTVPYSDVVTSTLPDGTVVQNGLWIFASPGAGLRYTALGEWSYSALPAGGEATQVYDALVFGLRTAPSDMPVTGTATYQSQLFDAFCDCGGQATFTADFASGSLSAQLSISDFEASIDVAGSGAISSNADFAFALAGEADIYGVGGAFMRTEDATGSLAGAFFGPEAQELGAVFSIDFASTPSPLIGSFAASR